MNKLRFFSVVFGLLGVCAATLGIWLAMTNLDASPVLVEQPKAAENQVQTMLEALCDQDYDTVSGTLYGVPGLGLGREAQDPVGQMLWQAYADSLTYELVGEFYVTDSGVARNVIITGLDLDSVTENLRTRAQTLLEQRVAQAEDPDEVYDENNEYREEFVMAVLYDAVQDALREDAKTAVWEFPLNLIYEKGQWWIMPESELLEAVSGGILG